MSSPADLLEGLITAGSGWTTRVGKLVDEPDQVIVFFDSGGLSPNPKWTVDYPSVQVIVRAAPNSYGVGYTKAKEVRNALLGLESQDLTGYRLDSITCMGDIAHVGYDSKERPTFSINFRLIMEPTSVGNREAM